MGRFNRINIVFATFFLLLCITFVNAAYYERATANHFGQRGLSELYSAHTFGAGVAVLGIYGNGTLDQNFLKNYGLFYYDSVSNGDTLKLDVKKPKISTFTFNPFVGIGLADFLDASLMLPVYLDMSGHYQEFGIGDLQIAFKLGTHAAYSMPVFDVGFLTALSIPTGSKEVGVFPRHPYSFNKDSLVIADTAIFGAYYSSQSIGFEPHLMVTLDLGALNQPVPLALFLDGGMHFAAKVRGDNAVLMGAGLKWNPSKSVALVAEANSEMRFYNFTHGFKLNQDPLALSPQIIITPANGLMLTIGSKISLSASSLRFNYAKHRDTDRPEYFSTGIEPRWRVFTQIGWNGIFNERDHDHDGIADRYDQCPDEPEDVDGFQDDDGCPDYDNDKDGIPDTLDKCRDSAEDKDGYKDDDGCPDHDNDNDRIADSTDKCPMLPEDFDGYQDDDGCPDYDNDRDGIPDSLDKCPTVPEDYDNFQDGDGCPDIDNDLDGVPDSVDRCPDLAGPPDNKGCPVTESQKEKLKVKEIKRGRVILRGVTFESGTAILQPASFPILDNVAASLTDWPQVRVEIQGHTDRSGTIQRNIELSTSRAESVRSYLISKGIDPGRLTTVGKADSDPIGDNSTKAGRAINNRIELRRIDP